MPAPSAGLSRPGRVRAGSRQKSRLRTHLASGVEVGLFLERGTVLRGGDQLQAEEGTIIEVVAADETVSTVVSADSPSGPELLLEPAGHPAVKPYRDALVEDGIPLAQFAVDDVEAEYERLTRQGVTFTQAPTDIGTAVVAVLDDTCGNLIQLIAMKPAAS